MRRSMGGSNRSSLRPGLISLLTLVIMLSIATAAVLTIATSHAMAALSQRQANMTSEGYWAEKSAQTMLALVDDALQASTSSKAAGEVKAVDQRMDKILLEACEDGVTATYKVDDNKFTCTFVTTGGRMLTTKISLLDGKSYDVVSWKLTAAPQDEGSDDTLWSGPTAQE
ncbi:MAG: hypothetical protein U0J70_01405 [Atopobiaceae bacterium]|nr:hypothetical protein [Atopobiaceae bacterium]